MSRKNTNRTLVIVFVILLVAVAANFIIRNIKGERTFRDDIIEYKAEDISKILIQTQGSESKTELYREDTVWKLRAGDRNYAADQELARGIAEELAFITPDRLVANKKDLWGDYDVTDTSGIKLTIYGPRKEKTGLIIGRFSYNQNTRKPSTFLRLEGENEVFAVEGYLGMTFNREADGLRDKKLLMENKQDITRLTFTYPDSSFVLSREANAWLIDGSRADSAKMAGYLSVLTYLAGLEFRDDFKPEMATGSMLRILVEGNNMQPAELTAYTDGKGSVLVSSRNPETYFSGDKGEIFSRIFKGREYFLTPSVKK